MAEALAILLVGGGGFIGTRVAGKLRAEGHAVTVLSRGRHATPSSTVRWSGLVGSGYFGFDRRTV